MGSRVSFIPGFHAWVVSKNACNVCGIVAYKRVKGQDDYDISEAKGDKMKLKKRVIQLIVFLSMTMIMLGGSVVTDTGYGHFMGLDLYVRYNAIMEDFSHIVEERNYTKLIQHADEFISQNPQLDRGYYFRFVAGILKKDLNLVRKSLAQMTDKYVVMLDVYRGIRKYEGSTGDKRADKTFISGVKEAVMNFFDDREQFLKKKLQRGINRLTILKELALINDQAGSEDDFIIYVKELLPIDYQFTMMHLSWCGNPNDPRFKELKNAYFKEWNSWSGTPEEKIRGLLKLSTEMRYWSAALDFAGIPDWSSHVAAYIPKVLTADSKTGYYSILAEIAASIEDDHTRINFPYDIRSIYSGCGISTTYSNGKFLVQSVTQDVLKKRIKPGDEITALDGVPVKEYLAKMKSVWPFAGNAYKAKTIQFEYYNARFLLYGKKDSSVSVGFKRPNGRTFQLSLVRDIYKNKSNGRGNKKAVELTVMKGNIFSFKIRRFSGGDVYREFLDLIKGKETAGVKGVIIDVRDNGGGNSGFGDLIFSHFIQKPVKNYIFAYHPVRSPREMRTSGLGYLSRYSGGVPIEPASERIFTCPVAVLISPGTGSAAECFVFLFKYHKRGVIIGQPSAGGTGMGHMVMLPGGGFLRINLNVDTFFSRRGIQPDHLIDVSPLDLQKDRDVYLKKALDLLKE